jgi:hypothetical protein
MLAQLQELAGGPTLAQGGCPPGDLSESECDLHVTTRCFVALCLPGHVAYASLHVLVELPFSGGTDDYGQSLGQ